MTTPSLSADDTNRAIAHFARSHRFKYNTVKYDNVLKFLAVRAYLVNVQTLQETANCG